MATKSQQKKFAAALDKNFNEWLEKVAIEVFREAQKNAPSQSGALINSATWMLTPEGFQIEYKAPYAFKLHEGGNAGELIADVDTSQFPWKADTKRHKRKLPHKTVWVRRHIKTYKKMYKPTKVGKQWKAINYINEQDSEANRWVQKAWDKIYRKQVGKDKTGKLKDILPKTMVITKSNITN